MSPCGYISRSDDYGSKWRASGQHGFWKCFSFLELLLWDCMTWFTFFLSNQQNDHDADKEKDDDVRQGFKGEDEKFLLPPPSRAETEPCIGG